nr:MAG TPA: hypothetical protein [Caudoviricetes sp.]
MRITSGYAHCLSFPTRRVAVRAGQTRPSNNYLTCGPFLVWGRAGKGPLNTYTYTKKKEF